MKPSFFSKENADFLKNLLDAGNIFEAISVNDLECIAKNEKAMEKLNEYWKTDNKVTVKQSDNPKELADLIIEELKNVRTND